MQQECFFLPLFSCNFNNQLSSKFHRLVILWICWDKPVRRTVFDNYQRCPVPLRQDRILRKSVRNTATPRKGASIFFVKLSPLCVLDQDRPSLLFPELYCHHQVLLLYLIIDLILKLQLNWQAVTLDCTAEFICLGFEQSQAMRSSCVFLITMEILSCSSHVPTEENLVPGQRSLLITWYEGIFFTVLKGSGHYW